MEKQLVISLCGTSILTNGASDRERMLLSKYANAATKDAIPEDDRNVLENRLLRILEEVGTIESDKIPARSAELHSISRLYQSGVRLGKNDHQYLICTDTWLGEQAAHLVGDWLSDQGLVVEVYKHANLQTKDLTLFQWSLSDLVKVLSGTCRNYKEAGYGIIFNLTGGFKSVQGFMQSLAMLYADEAVYVFESGHELLRIPRLPIQMAAREELKEQLMVFRRLNMQLAVDHGDLEKVNPIFVIRMDGECGFSAWGEILWDQHSRDIYSEKLWPPISKRLRFGPRFAQSTNGFHARRMYEINRKIDMLCRFLEKGSTYNVRSLDFKSLSGNPVPGSTHELDAWHDQDAKRMYGHYEEDGKVFVLDKLDKALH